MKDNKGITIQSYERIRVIDELLTQKLGNQFTFYQIFKIIKSKFNGRAFSRRTFDEDIFNMKKLNLPLKVKIIKKSLKNVDSNTIDEDGSFYYYDENLITDLVKPLCQKEQIDDNQRTQLMTAMQSLNSLSGFPFFKTLEGVLSKMKAQIQDFDEINETKKYIQFENCHLYDGIKYFDIIAQAINQKKALDIKIDSNNFKVPYTAHLYFLKEFENKWYVLCSLDYTKIQESYTISKKREDIENRISFLEKNIPNSSTEVNLLHKKLEFLEKGELKTICLENIISAELDNDQKFISIYRPEDNYFDYVYGYSRTLEDVPINLELEIHQKYKKRFFNNLLLTKHEIFQESELSFKVRYNIIINNELKKRLQFDNEWCTVINPLNLI
jgi:hypothetical protein